MRTGASRPTTMHKGDGPPVILDYAPVVLFPRRCLVDGGLQ
ncbi:MAG TPA: hypothetical protein VMU94_03795 [Streptosporangiaceae bacterium]|nr:hypothetical protein [Streptosporangiaceae bacterium]